MKGTYFKSITEDSAYVLGFLHADGFMSKNKGYIKFSQTESDILKKINKVMGESYSISEYQKEKHQLLYGLQINSVEMCRDLEALGIHPQKSKTVGWPPIPSNFFRHFIRGVFDGDGCISCIKEGKNGGRGSWMIHFTTASALFASALLNWLQAEDITCRLEKYKNKECWTIYVSTGFGNGEKFYDLLYKDASIYMQRKYDKFQSFLSTKPRQKSSKYKGLSWCKRSNKWRVIMTVKGTTKRHWGSYPTEEEALARRDEVLATNWSQVH